MQKFASEFDTDKFLQHYVAKLFLTSITITMNQAKELFKDFKICNLEEKKMNRYEHPKILWEFCIKKEK